MALLRRAWLSAAWGLSAQAALAVPAIALRLPVGEDKARQLNFLGELPVQLFLPPGSGPFPLALLQHERRFYTAEFPAYPAATAYFVERGIAVAVPARIGYGPLDGEADREWIYCPRPDPGRVFVSTSLQAAAVLEGLSQSAQPIDRQRVLHVGVGVGGLAALSAAMLSPQGVIAAINFGGGVGGYAERFPRQPCGAQQTEALCHRLGRAAAALRKAGGQAPSTLWVYARNDEHFGDIYPQRWHRAFRRGGGQSRLAMVDAWGDDGNRLFADGLDRWRPLVDDFLATLPRLATPVSAPPR